MTGPIRSCVACRERAEPDELIRLVAFEGFVQVDLRGRLPGRGAWLHPRAACVADLERRPGKLGKAFGADASVVGLGDRLREAVHRAALDGLSQAAAAGALVGGHDLLSEALRAGGIEWVVVASDASPRTVEELRACAGEVPFSVLPLTTQALGTRIGRGLRAALGVRGSRASSHLLRQLRRLRDLG